MACLAFGATLLAGCSTFFPSIGASRKNIDNAAQQRAYSNGSLPVSEQLVTEITTFVKSLK